MSETGGSRRGKRGVGVRWGERATSWPAFSHEERQLERHPVQVNLLRHRRRERTVKSIQQQTASCGVGGVWRSRRPPVRLFGGPAGGGGGWAHPPHCRGAQSGRGVAGGSPCPVGIPPPPRHCPGPPGAPRTDRRCRCAPRLPVPTCPPPPPAAPRPLLAGRRQGQVHGRGGGVGGGCERGGRGAVPGRGWRPAPPTAPPSGRVAGEEEGGAEWGRD